MRTSFYGKESKVKNILYLHAGAEMYGADKILLELVTGLDKSKYRPIVVLPETGILVEKLREAGVDTYVVEYPILRRKYFNPRGIAEYVTHYSSSSKEIMRLLENKGIKIDIIHVNTTAVLEGIYLKRKLQAKLLWHVHEIILKPKLIYKFISYLIGKYADKCVVVSEAVKKHLINSKMIKPKKIKVIYNGVDSEIFSPDVDYGYLLQEWDIPQNAIKVGVIGRLNAWKGQNDFLDATEPLLAEYDNLYLFVIGSPFAGQEWRLTDLRKRIEQSKFHDRIIFSEFRKDNAAVHNLLDILVLPSTNPDPLPTVVLEAMASGKPVVGYAHGGICEMVISGENGLLAKVNDPVDMRQKVNELVNSKKKRIKFGKASRKRQLDNFSLISFIEAFERSYNEL